MCIGWLVATPELGGAQSAAVLWSVDDVERTLGGGVEADLRTDRAPSWRLAWDRASSAGPAIASALWEHAGHVRNTTDRLLWIAAYSAAAGTAGDDQLMALAARSKAAMRERLIALLALACGPRRSGDGAPLRRLLAESRSQSLTIAALLALERFAEPPGNLSPRLLRSRRVDPGVLAAALYAGVDVSRELLSGRIDGAQPGDDAARLVWRAVLLGRGGAARRDRLVPRVLAGADLDDVVVRQAAAVGAARAVDPSACLVGLTGELAPELVVLLSSTPAGRQLCLDRGWLRPIPAASLDDGLRRRLGVCFAVTAGPAAVIAAVPQWRGDAVVGPVTHALAWRAFARSGAFRPGSWQRQLAGATAAPLLGLALEQSDLPASLADGARPRLQLVYRLARDGRLPAPGVAREIEFDLWLSGDHPGRAACDCRMQLLRDLLLSGSLYVQRRLATRAFDYLPEDLRPDDAGFFEVAYEYWQWMAGAEQQVTAEYLLGN